MYAHYMKPSFRKTLCQVYINQISFYIGDSYCWWRLKELQVYNLKECLLFTLKPHFTFIPLNTRCLTNVVPNFNGIWTGLAVKSFASTLYWNRIQLIQNKLPASGEKMNRASTHKKKGVYVSSHKMYSTSKTNLS